MKKAFSPPAPEKRAALLETQRQLKMARSAHAYVRGNTLQFYDWLQTPTATTVPAGPSIWICGDCHVGNIGPVASSDGKVELEIRDLDQTVIGNPAHDLIRLGLSLATAARGSDLPGVTTARMIEQMIDGYRDALNHRALNGAKGKDSAKGKQVAAPIEEVLRAALRRRWKHLAVERIEDVAPKIPIGKRFWPLLKSEAAEIRALFATEPARNLVTCLKERQDDAKVEVVDAAYWMKGCSSLGRLRYAVLLRVGKQKGKDGTYCLVDIKEAVPAAAPRAKDSKVFKDHALRVVEGATQLSPYLGKRMLAAELSGRSVVIRELLPQDLKLEMETLKIPDAMQASRHLAFVVGRAHARQMTVKQKKAWDDVLNRSKPKTLEAPSWLWKSVLELMARHEAAYLEHCRCYALKA